MALAGELLPLRLHLGDPATADHYIELTGPADVALVEHKGLRLACQATVAWPVLGVDIPIHVDAVTVLIEPSIATGDGEAEFTIEVENADISWVPALVDRGIVRAINGALHERRAELRWQFAETLSHVFGMPAFLQPLHALSLKVAWGKVRTSEAAVVLAVSFHARATRQDGETLAAVARVLESRAPSPDRGLARRDPTRRGTVAVGTLLALVTGWMAVRGTYRLLAQRRLGRAW